MSHDHTLHRTQEHARTLALARSQLAALADGAHHLEASSAYEHVLIELDRLYLDDVPALDHRSRGGEDNPTLYPGAVSTLEALVDHGLDGLQIELVLAMLADAHDLDAS